MVSAAASSPELNFALHSLPLTPPAAADSSSNYTVDDKADARMNKNGADYMRVRTFGGFLLHGDCFVPVAVDAARPGSRNDISNGTHSQYYQQFEHATHATQSRGTTFVDNMRYAGAAAAAAAATSPDRDRCVEATSPSPTNISPLPPSSSYNQRKFRSRAQKYCRRLCSRHTLETHLPILRWLPKYDLNKLQCDAIAGITVGLTAIPQCLAYAAIATLPLQYGLYSAFMGCFVYTLLGTSKDITLGPTAITSLMTAEYLQHIQDDDLRTKYAVLLGFVTGVVQFMMGVLQLGFLVRFISHPVIVGFVSAAALSIAATQVDDVLGYSVKSRDFFPSIYEIVVNINKIRWTDFLLGAGCIVGLVGMRAMGNYAAASATSTSKNLVQRSDDGMVQPRRGGILILKYVSILRNAIIVVLACAAAAVLEATRGPGTFRLAKRVTPGIPVPSLPSFALDVSGFMGTLRQLGSGVILMPIVAILESLAIGKAFANRNGYNIDTTQEIIAIGACNTLSSVFHGYPITGSFSRTALNSACGVKTPAGGLWTGALVLLALSVLSPLFRFVPEAALGAVIICAVLPMVEWHEIKLLWHVRKLDLMPCLLTFFGCLLFGIEIGISVGVVVSLLMLAYAAARPEVEVIEWLSHNVVLIRPHAALYFPSGEFLQNVVEKTMQSIKRQRRRGEKRNADTRSSSDDGLADRETVRFVLDAACIADFDASAMRALKVVIDTVGKEPHFELCFVNLSAETQRLLTAVGCKSIKSYDSVLNDAAADERQRVAVSPVPNVLATTTSPLIPKRMQPGGTEL